MSGNVSEITLSCYPPDIKHLPAWETTREWLDKSVDESCGRVLRGGEFAGDISRARVAWRMAIKETLRAAFVGFRTVKEMN
jgi:formylglycine-generating enzyme required for sulfatase activity